MCSYKANTLGDTVALFQSVSVGGQNMPATYTRLHSFLGGTVVPEFTLVAFKGMGQVSYLT